MRPKVVDDMVVLIVWVYSKDVLAEETELVQQPDQQHSAQV